MADDSTFTLSEIPVHLGLGATVVPQERFTGDMDWYERHGADGVEGRLVSMHTFTASWDTWDMHPNGEELVVCTDGELTLTQEVDGEARSVVLGAGAAVVNPLGCGTRRT